MTVEEKRILLTEMQRYIKENNYYTDGGIKYDNLWLLGWVAGEFRNRKSAMKAIISNEYGLLGNLMYKLMLDPDPTLIREMEELDLKLLMKAIKHAGSRTIERNELEVDPYAMRLLIVHDRKYVKYLAPEVMNNKAFLTSIVSSCPDILKDVSSRTVDDIDFALSLVEQNYMCLRYLPSKFRREYSICREAVKREGYSLMWIEYNPKGNDDLVLLAVQNRGNALSMATKEQRRNRTIVKAAVSSYGGALEYADETLKHDYEIVMMAVSNAGLALHSAAPELAARRDVVEAAVRNDGYALRFAAEPLRDDYDLAMLAMASYPEAYRYLSERLQNLPELKEIYNKSREEAPWLRSRKQQESAKGSC